MHETHTNHVIIKDLSMAEPCIVESEARSGYEGVVQSTTRQRSGLTNLSSPRVLLIPQCMVQPCLNAFITYKVLGTPHIIAK